MLKAHKIATFSQSSYYKIMYLKRIRKREAKKENEEKSQRERMKDKKKIRIKSNEDKSDTRFPNW